MPTRTRQPVSDTARSHGVRHWFTALAIAVLAVAGTVCPAATLDDTFEYARYIERNEWKRAEVHIRKSLRKPGLEDRLVPLLTADLAMVLRLQGKAKEAIKELAALDATAASASKVRLEKGCCLLALGAPDKAAECFALCQESREVPVRCSAGYEMARLRFAGRDYAGCIVLCEKVIQDGTACTGPEVAKTVEATRELLGEARGLRDPARYGADYLNYRAARLAEKRDDYAAALKSYAKIRTPGVLKDAAECYAPGCLLKLGEAKKAVRGYKEIIERKEFSLYQGEAMLALAAHYYLSERGEAALGLARDLLRQAVEWNRRAAGIGDGDDLSGIGRVLEDFPVPKEFTRPDDLGNLLRNRAGPESVVNQMTCPWYLPRQEFLALLWRTFILSEIGDKEAAPALLDRVRAVNDLRGGHLLSRPGILERLQADLNRGAFLVPEPVWGCLPRPGGGRFRAGAFFYVAGENELARSLFQEAQASPTRTRAKRDEQAVILYGLACCDFSDGKDEQAISRLSKFTDELRTSPLAASAQMLLANIYSGIQGKYKDALAVYDGIAGRGAADSSVAAKALLAKAVSACNHNDNPTALDTCKQLRQVYGRTPYGLAASTLASRLEDGAQTLRQEMPRADPDGAANRGNGRIVLVRRHLVFPGGGDLARASYDDLDVSDLLRYDITTSTIAPCIVVKQYTIRLTEFEPQFEPVAGRACAFLRAPVLFHTMPDK